MTYLQQGVKGALDYQNVVPMAKYVDPEVGRRQTLALVEGSSSSSIDLLIKNHTNLVTAAVRKMSVRLPSHVDRDDLTSVGMIALWEAARDYDSNRKVEFKDYANPKIRGGILDELRRLDHLTRGDRKRLRNFRNLEAKYRGIFDEEAAVSVGLSVQAYREARYIQKVSYEPIEDHETELSDAKSRTSEELLLSKEGREKFWQGVDKLPEQLRAVILLYDGPATLSFKEIGMIFGVGQSMISRIHTKARIELTKLLINQE